MVETRPSLASPGRFAWTPQPSGMTWIRTQIERFVRENSLIEAFAARLKIHTGSRLIDWIDHLSVRDVDDIQSAGFEHVGNNWYQHPGALLPAVQAGLCDQMLLRVDSVSDFVAANGGRTEFDITGRPLDLWRTAVFRSPTDTLFGVVERHGCNSLNPALPLTERQRVEIAEMRELWHHRPRRFQTIAEAFELTADLIRKSTDQIGRDVTCDLFFEAERHYWHSRNRAAQVQLMRQNAIGLGWGNHDHHTYRSSRTCFSRLMEIMEQLGLQCREQFYAGSDAGWGAQVLEHPVCGVVVFADVDLSPEELDRDIARSPLSAGSSLGTIGLWCALHGEAIFAAGLHHLECQFDFDEACAQLADRGIHTMPPFTNFPFLKQCFTEGELWPVESSRLSQSLAQGLITSEEADRFQKTGAVGSHLEILERNDGYRGFNQTGINDIIRRTDPRFVPIAPAGR